MHDPDIQLDHRPGFEAMRKIGGQEGATGATREDAGGVELEAARTRAPKIHPQEYFEGREGFDPSFLDPVKTPLPKPLGRLADDVLPIRGAKNRLDYHHFSVVMSKSRRMAMFVAVNIDGKKSKALSRGSDVWYLDGRIDAEAQIGEDLYSDNLLDRGHLVRREDPNWGTAAQAEAANEDTFHFTNCSPQMASFNEKTWLGLENYILLNTRKWKERVTVFTGPFFSRNDLDYRAVRIPVAYWKVVAFISDDGKPSATAYTIDQETELRDLEAAFAKFKTYQRSIAYIEKRAHLDFGKLRQYDGFSNHEEDTGVRLEAVLNSPADIRL
jgi:endonuclease G